MGPSRRRVGRYRRELALDKVEGVHRTAGVVRPSTQHHLGRVGVRVGPYLHPHLQQHAVAAGMGFPRRPLTYGQPLLVRSTPRAAPKRLAHLSRRILGAS